jgi:serine/threonine protein kinase
MPTEFITHKKGTFDKTIFKVTTKHNVEYIVRVSKRNLNHELVMYNTLRKMLVSSYFAEIYDCKKKGNKYICFSEFIMHDIMSFYKKVVNKKNNDIFWKNLFMQLSHVLNILELNQICHNDLHLGNIMVDGHSVNHFKIKIIDLETMTDYKNGIIPTQILDASNKEKNRLGWNTKFKIGLDANQVYGELCNNFKDDIPKHILKKLLPLLKCDKTKEFAYTVPNGNKELSGKKILKLFY